MAITRKTKPEFIPLSVRYQSAVEERLQEVERTDSDLRKWVNDAIAEMQSRVAERLAEVTARNIETVQSVASEAARQVAEETSTGVRVAELEKDLQILATDFDEFADAVKRRIGMK